MAEKNAKKKTAKSRVQSGDKAETKIKNKKTKKPEGAKGKSFKENIITDSETAKARGRNGGVKSGEVRRAKRNARETIQYMLEQMTTSKNVRDNLRELGFEENEFSNMAALHGRLFTMAMGGNIEAYMTLMKMGGYEPKENREERESLAADRRRETELDAKLHTLGQAPIDATMAVGIGNEDGGNDVVIYIPKMMTEEECQYRPPEKEETDKTAGPQPEG